MPSYPALDIAAAALFLLFFRPPSGESGVSTSLLPPRALLVLRVSRWEWGGVSAGALRLRVVVVRVVGGDPVSVVDDGDACVLELSAWSLAAEARVTLCDMGK